ncbi:MAG: hypothetical protein ACXV3F_07890 [Frankiaceae bacterium]
MAPLAVLLWIPTVLVLDRFAGSGEQALLGVVTWVLLVALLRREDGLTRAQVAVVVGSATLVEYAFSAVLGVYVYRLGGVAGVPAFVPPGHGLVYLAALCLGRSASFRSRPRVPVMLAAAGVSGYAMWGLFALPRLDVLGALWAGCLLLFLWRGRAPLVYAGAFVVVTYLEILGTSLGTWTWQAYDPTGIVAIGNPPSGAAGGYGFFDAAALLLAPLLVRTVGWMRASALLRLRQGTPPGPRARRAFHAAGGKQLSASRSA